MYDKFNNLTSYAWIRIQTVAVISKTTSITNRHTIHTVFPNSEFSLTL